MAKKAIVYSPVQPKKVRNLKSANTEEPITPEFDSVDSIRKTVDAMQQVENLRAQDRALIDTLANGERPFSAQEVEESQIEFNVNWGDLRNALVTANSQLNGALLFKPTLFTATSKGGQVEKRDEYSQKFTSKINRAVLKGKVGDKYRYLIKSRNASVTLHGPGIVYWPNGYCPLPDFVPLENFLVPSDTMQDFSNCSFFNIKVELTPWCLFERTHGDVVDENWDMEQVHFMLDGLQEAGALNVDNYDWVNHPEKMQELYKQNRSYLNSDAVSKVKLSYFFSKEKDGKWYLKIFMREGIGEADSDKFVYESKTAFADELSQIIHAQHGDISLVPPHRYHSERGLGASLYSACWALNMFRSDLFQHAREQARMYLRIDAPADKARENMVSLKQYGILEQGVSIVPQNERHQIDVSLVDNVIAQCRQNISDNSSSYIQDLDNGSEKERTFGEAKIIQQTANSNVSSLLTGMYFQENPLYEEIVRRFLASNSGDADIEAFQKDCVEDGIPKDLLTYDNWVIEPDRVLGAGDNSLALQQATALFQTRTAFDPKSQRMINRTFVSTLTGDPAKGLLYVPDAPDNSDSGTKSAEDVFGTLMSGVPVELREGIDQTSYIQTMMKGFALVVEQIKSTDNVGTISQIAGLGRVSADIKQHLEIVSADPSQKMFTKQMSDAMSKLDNDLRGFAQRLTEQNGKKKDVKEFDSLSFKDLEAYPAAQAAWLQEAGYPTEKIPIADPKVAKAAQSLQITNAKFKQKQQQQAISFQLEQVRKFTEMQADLTLEQQRHNQEMAHDASMKLAELMNELNKPEPISSE